MAPEANTQSDRDKSLVGEDSDVIRGRKEAQSHRRLEADEEERLLRSTEPHLQALIIAALETCCREGELLTLTWGDVSIHRGEIIIRAENTKDRENRIIPISARFRQVLEMRRNSSAGVPFPPSAYVFGDDIGRRVGSVRRAWQTSVLRAHGYKPTSIWKKKSGSIDKGTTRLSPESEAAYRAIDLHFHDLRHEGARDSSRLAGPCITCSTCSAMRRSSRPATYLNATFRGLHESMRTLDQSRPACKPLANKPARGFRPLCKQAPAKDGNSFCH